MGFSYTQEQQQVIDSRDCNLLVCAAAGSGKTAVLVERIVRMVSDKAHPVDIDRLLIVTFTNAAAAQMRERISAALSRRLEEDTENAHLQRQVTLLHNARITTIHSFCLFVIRNNFNDIGLDPGFRVADEGEIKMLRGDVMAELVEAHFERQDEGFLHCLESFSPGGDEKMLAEHIQRLYDYSRAYPFPEQWLSQAARTYAPSCEEEAQESDWLAFASADLEKLLAACVGHLEEAIGICEEADGPYMYLPVLEAERDMLDKCRGRSGFSEYEKGFGEIAFGRLPSKKDAGVAAEKRELVKGMRSQVKEALEKAADRYFFMPFAFALADLQESSHMIGTLTELALEFGRRFADKKQEKNVLDFGDIEHYALQIILEETERGYVPARAAREYRSYFHEILIDEYQDSNLVQELLLQSISGEEEGRYNRFMVGDVKQSIYKFRLARPEIFLEKMGRYTAEGKERKISLRRNFRSRREVTDQVNCVFSRIMGKELGGIVYDEEAALYPGAEYPEYGEAEAELLLLEREEESQSTKVEQEAVLIAERIRSLKETHQVTDEDSGKLRPVCYGDIAILLRTNAGWDETLQSVLKRYGIPAHTATSTGYFSSEEIRTMLHVLRILDNPLQDIPLFGVMRSLIGQFTDSDIACLRAICPEGTLYEALETAGGGSRERGMGEKTGPAEMNGRAGEADTVEEEEPVLAAEAYVTKGREAELPEGLAEKARRLLELIRKYRERMVYEPVKQLLREILAETGYLQYMTAFPEGDTRRANLEMLLLRAAAFEETGSHGLFSFIRYMEQLEKYEVDYGEAATVDEQADVVRIMSIHKSKGLEFPVCIVGGLAKRFNIQDQTKSLLMDVDFGLGCEYVDPKRRFRRTTLRRNVLARKMQLDNLGEELRILYVAMTRAREKLIMTACIPEPEKKLASLGLTEEGRGRETGRLSFLTLSGAGSLLDFLLPVWKGCKVIRRDDLCADQLKTQVKEQWRAQQLKTYEQEAYDKKWQDIFRQRFSYEYPKQLSRLYTKTTVSELKLERMTGGEEGASHLFPLQEEAYIPRFCTQEEKLSGAARGSAFHRAMELLDFAGLILTGSREKLTDMVNKNLEAFVRSGRMTEEECGCIDRGMIADFLMTETAERMQKAAVQGMLWKEQPFMLGLAADRVNPEFPADETVLIQGIIDVYWEEEGELVVLDYKTDRVNRAYDLISRYQTQLAYYGEALTRMTGKPVREEVIYSFYLNETLRCSDPQTDGLPDGFRRFTGAADAQSAKTDVAGNTQR